MQTIQMEDRPATSGAFPAEIGIRQASTESGESALFQRDSNQNKSANLFRGKRGNQ